MKKTNKIPVISPFDFCDKKNLREYCRGVFYDADLRAKVATNEHVLLVDFQAFRESAETGGVTTEKGEFIECRTPKAGPLLSGAESYPEITKEMPDPWAILAAAEAAKAAKKAAPINTAVRVCEGFTAVRVCEGFTATPEVARLIAVALLNYPGSVIRCDGAAGRPMMIDAGTAVARLLFMPLFLEDGHTFVVLNAADFDKF